MIFSLQQLQEKCRKQQQPFFLAFMDLTKAFDLVSGSGLFQIPQKIGCPPKLLTIITAFHEGMQSTVCFDRATLEAFQVSSEVKLGCVLASTLFRIFFSMLLQPMPLFADCSEGVYIWMRADSKLFNTARLCAKTKTLEVLVRKLLFTDDATLASHCETGLQGLVENLSHTCKEFGLTCTISLKKTSILAQDEQTPPVITIDNTEPEVVDSSTYLGSTMPSKASLDDEISSRIAKATGVMAKLNKRVWNNDLLCEGIKLQVYQSFVLSTLLYSSKSWPTYSRQEKWLNGFHLCCLQHFLQIKWQDRAPNTTCLASLHYSSKNAYHGSVMYTIWNSVACQGKSSVGNCRRASNKHSFTSRMFASPTCNLLISIPTPGRSLRQTAKLGIMV